MAKISALDFARNVEKNRKSLIQHCLKNGKNVSESETLDNVVAINSQISTSNPDGYFKVEFKDLDGNPFAPTQYVQKGGSATLPSTYPELDPDILEFVEWFANGDLTNVQDNLVCLPQYQTKINEVANQRPSILKCYFTDKTLSPRIYFDNTYRNTFIDWGDGSVAQQVTSNYISHTYEKAGLYTILIYGDDYVVGGSTQAGVFADSTYSSCLLKAYLGENIKRLAGYMFNNCYVLNQVVIPSHITNSYSSNGFSNCKSLTNIVLPNITIVHSKMFENCSALETVVLSKNTTQIYPSAFNYCYSLKNITLPSGVNSLGDSSFNGCYSLSSIILPKSITSINSLSFNTCSGLVNAVLFDDFDLPNLYLRYSPLSEDCLVDIANKLKDNSGVASKTITMSKQLCETKLKSIMLDQLGNRVPYGTEGAVSVLEFMQNKNWTISLI